VVQDGSALAQKHGFVAIKERGDPPVSPCARDGRCVDLFKQTKAK
jgi:hypothetical protein